MKNEYGFGHINIPLFILNMKIVGEGSHFNNDMLMKVQGLESAKIAGKRIILIKLMNL